MKKNNWYVITGAPSSGKTTLLKLLEEKGYAVFYEWARIYIDEQLRKGKTLRQIRKNELTFQRKILKLKVDFEKNLNPNKQLFMERGIPDSDAYMQMCGLQSDTVLKQALKHSWYKKVFLLELIKYESDYARTESQEEAMLLDSLLEKSYTNLGIQVVRVPKMSTENRTKFILDNI